MQTSIPKTLTMRSNARNAVRATARGMVMTRPQTISDGRQTAINELQNRL